MQPCRARRAATGLSALLSPRATVSSPRGGNTEQYMVLRAFQGACRNKVLYFHENQLEYPKRKEDDEWDFHFAWIQCTRLRCAAMPRCALTQCKPVLSCLVADRVAFNSAWNRGECSEGCTWLQRDTCRIRSFRFFLVQQLPAPHNHYNGQHYAYGGSQESVGGAFGRFRHTKAHDQRH